MVNSVRFPNLHVIPEEDPSGGGGGGTVTNVSGVAPIHVINGTTTPVVSHDPSGVTPTIYGDASHVGQFAVDVDGHLTAAASVPITGFVVNTFSTVWAYGDGSDGNFTLDGAAIPAWATLAGTTYTMTRDIYMVDLTLNAGITLNTVGRRMFFQGTFTCNGLVATNGFSGGGATAGNGATGSNWYVQAQAGGGGGNPGNGGAGVSSINSCVTGAGGKGGDSGVRTGGNSGGVGTFSNRDGGNRHICDTFPTIFWGTCPSGAQIAAGPGGGGGAGDGATRAGGGAGGAAGILGIFAFKIAGNGTLQAKGGNGADGGPGGTIGCGGGGGGPGGALFIITTTLNYASLLTIDLSGGAGGLGTFAAANGAAGATGFTYQMFTY